MSATSPIAPQRVLIIGLGRIGQGYDYSLPADRHVFTHARAFSQHPGFILIGGIDPDATSRNRFTTQYGAPAFPDLAATTTLKPDVIVVATPTSQHLTTVRLALACFRPAVLVCEKPLAYDPADAEALLDCCAARGCAVYVNYMRRTDPTTATLRDRLADGRIAAPLKGVVWYAKGLYNSASHFVNLLEDLLGSDPEILQSSPGRTDFQGDPEPDFTLRFARGDVTFLSVRVEDYFHNAMEWISPAGRVRYERGGAVAEWTPRSPASVPGEHAMLGAASETLPGDFARIQAHFTHALAGAMTGQPSPICTGAQALATLRLLHQIQPCPQAIRP
jgi:predicted dehydrogenase